MALERVKVETAVKAVGPELDPRIPTSPQSMSSLGAPDPLPDFGGMGPPTGTPRLGLGQGQRSPALRSPPPEEFGGLEKGNKDLGLSDDGSTGKDKDKDKDKDVEQKNKQGLLGWFVAAISRHLRGIWIRFPNKGKDAATALADWPIVLHVILVIALTWLLGRLHMNGLLAIAIMVLAMHEIHVIHRQREKAKWRVDFRKSILANESMTDEETTRWLNAALARAWPVFLERFMSVHIVPKLLPWFLEKFKPKAVKHLELKGVNLGSEPPLLTGARMYSTAADGNHVELEMNVEMICGKDMFLQLVAHVGDAKWGLGLIPWNAYATDLQLLGRCQVGIRFLHHFPFIDRVSVSFVSEPHVAMSVKVMGMGLAQGFDAAGLPVVAGYVDATLKRALRGSLVAPNKLVITDITALLEDVISANCSHDREALHAAAGDMGPPIADEHPVGFVRVELMEGEHLISADRNGLSDPYVRGSLGPAKFHSSIKRKTLNPKWFEDFRVPVLEWNDQMVLRIQVKDYDRFSSDDDLGWCEINIKGLEEGARHEKWLKLEGVKTGRVHAAVTVEANPEEAEVDQQQGVHETPTGDTAHVQTQTVSKGGGVTTASAQLHPKDDEASASAKGGKKIADGRKEGEIAKKADTTQGLYTRRAVKMGKPSYEVARGVQIYTWDD